MYFWKWREGRWFFILVRGLCFIDYDGKVFVVIFLILFLFKVLGECLI